MPPGGHCEPSETPEETAKRECKEETGLDVEILGLEDIDAEASLCGDLFATCPEEGNMLKTPIAMLLENIPASESRNEPAHQHMDFLFLARPLDENQALCLAEEEGERMQWFTRQEVEALDESKEVFGNVK